jgi:hypothetical protein
MRPTKVLVAKLDPNMLGVDMGINAICCRNFANWTFVVGVSMVCSLFSKRTKILQFQNATLRNAFWNVQE